MKRMAIPDPSACVFYRFTRKFEDSERQYTWNCGGTPHEVGPARETKSGSTRAEDRIGNIEPVA